MKKPAIILLVTCLSYLGRTQTPGEWTWVSGSNNNNTTVFGTQGVPSISNTPNYSYESRKWTDDQGNFWLYGGFDLTSGVTLCDLWRFNPVTTEWTWMKGNGLGDQQPVFGVQGVSSPLTNPGICNLGNSASWKDLQNNLWLLESNNVTNTCILWKYDLALNEWAWISGNIPANYGTIGIPSLLNNPEPFFETPVSWTDDEGDLWFLDGYNGGVMWEYDIATNQWTWMNGDPSSFNFGVYAPKVLGTLGVFSPTNTPGSGWYYTLWKANDGTFYLFGGNSYLSSDEYSAMCQFDPATNQWAWVGGFMISNLDTTASFVGECVFDPNNFPLSTLENTSCWVDECDRLWAYENYESYLWCYDPVIKQFALVDGDVLAGAPSSPAYGIQGISSPTNDPGAATGASAWVDSNGNLWRLGSLDPNSPSVFINSLWRYAINPNCLTINALAVATPSTGCGPLNVAFTASPLSSTYNYQWDFGVPNLTTDTSSVQNPSYVYTSAGTYTAQLIVSGNIGCNGAVSDTATITVTVTNPPIVNANDTALCTGSTVALTATGATTYTWSPAVGLNTTVGATVQASPTVTTSYIVTGTTGGCSATDTVIVTVNPLPTITVNSPTICPQGNATLTANGGNSYSWTPTATLSSSTGSPVTASPLVTTVYTVTGTDTTTLCSNTAQATVTIEISQIAVNSDTNCLGNPADVSTLIATGAATYVWSPATGLSASVGATVIATPAQTTVYTVIGTTANGCLDTATATVTVIPDFTVTVNSDSICVGQSVLLTANGATTYTWSPATGLSATTGTEVVANPTLTTVYTVTGTIAGCSETATSTVTVLAIPIASITANPNPASTIESTVSLQTNGNGNATNWYLNDSLISQLNSFAYTFPTEPGSYVVQLIVTNLLGCADTGYVTIVIQEDIIFYVPNSFTPNDDDFNNVFIPIITSGIDLKNYEFSIFNRWGELIFETSEIGVGWNGTYKGLKCQDGVYTWSLKFKSKYNDGIFEHTGHVTLVR